MKASSQPGPEASRFVLLSSLVFDPRFWVPALILVGSLAGWFLVTRIETPLPPVPAPPPLKAPDRKEFFDSTLLPLLHEHQQDNLAAAKRCLDRIDETFEQYRRGIKPFSDDLTSWGTRLGILSRMPADWWYQDGRVGQFVQAKFEQHLFSERQLHDALTSALNDFREELQAHRNQLRASLTRALSESDLSPLAIPDYQAYDEEVYRLLVEFSSKRAQDSVIHGIATFVVAEVVSVAGSQLATQIYVQLLAGLTTASATSTVAAGSATASGGAAGGAAGSAGGPFGTILGIGVGIVVGAIVDWWMTENFRARLEGDLNDYLTKVRDAIIEGHNGNSGLRAALEEFVAVYHQAEEQVLRAKILGDLP